MYGAWCVEKVFNFENKVHLINDDYANFKLLWFRSVPGAKSLKRLAVALLHYVLCLPRRQMFFFIKSSISNARRVESGICCSRQKHLNKMRRYGGETAFLHLKPFSSNFLQKLFIVWRPWWSTPTCSRKHYFSIAPTITHCLRS